MNTKTVKKKLNKINRDFKKWYDLMYFPNWSRQREFLSDSLKRESLIQTEEDLKIFWRAFDSICKTEYHYFSISQRSYFDSLVLWKHKKFEKSW